MGKIAPVLLYDFFVTGPAHSLFEHPDFDIACVQGRVLDETPSVRPGEEPHLPFRLVYPRGAIEPRHVHGGSHAAFVMLGQARADGKNLGPWDLMCGACGVTHGPIEFQDDVPLAVNVAGRVAHEQVAG